MLILVPIISALGVVALIYFLCWLVVKILVMVEDYKINKRR